MKTLMVTISAQGPTERVKHIYIYIYMYIYIYIYIYDDFKVKKNTSVLSDAAWVEVVW